MKSKFKDILKGAFLTSMAALTSVDSYADSDNSFHSKTVTKLDAEITKADKRNLLQKKLLLKFNNDNSTYTLASHRSHRSHSSHRSHYSHYSSSSSSSSESSSPSNSVKNTNEYNRTSINSDSSKVYKLGDRLLKKGMIGADVTELLNILITKKYITPKVDAPKVATGNHEFTQLIEDAVKDFQKDFKLKADGIVGPSTIYYLMK